MRAHPKVFDLLYVSMVSNAEKTGRLSETLLELAEWIAKQIEVRKQLMAALLYPALLSGFCLVVLSSLLFYVVPSLKELFNGRDLHPLTEIVFAVSAFACNSKSLLLALFSSLILIVAATFVSPQIHRKLAPISFKLPLLKPLLARVALIRFCRSAATLLEGGLPLTQAFSQARGVMRHPLLEEVVRQAEERISQGESIHAPFQNHPLIPPLIPRMMGIADEGGKLPFMMRQIAEIYEEDLEKTLTRFAALIQPLLLLALGLIIGLILLAVLLPLTDVSSFATG
jgi:general secretion pathway protein F/type IV pilus assembly protein PilC